jgi:recombination protein RecT
MDQGEETVTTQIQKATPQTQYVSIKQAMEAMAPQMAEVVPRHLSAEKLMKVALGSIKKDSKLLECSVSSLLSCVMEASKLGLSIGGILGEAHLVPFSREATLIIGYRGFVSLMRRGGDITTVRAVVVCEKDRFRYTEGLDPTIEHEPSLLEDRGAPTHVYAVAKWKDSDDCQFVVLGKQSVMKARAVSKKQELWDQHPEAYWQKTAIRRLAKLAPLDVDAGDAIERDDSREYIDSVAVEVAQETASVSASVKKQMAEKRKHVIQNEEPAPIEPPDDVVLPTVEVKP